ncbi:MAG: amine dehydrogenase large subunit [Pseudomonadota bacterium]
MVETRFWLGVGAALALLVGHAATAQDFPEPLPAEPVPAVESLDVPYADSVALIHDFSFNALVDAAYYVIDTATQEMLGLVSASHFASATWSKARSEIYLAETYYSRGTRGDRSDLITIYDMVNLQRTIEIEIPKKRAAIVAMKPALAITASGKFLLSFNMNPGTSVSVVDLDSRSFVGEISTPGCSLVYPTRKHDFFMLCGDGALLSVSLNDDGAEVARQRSDAFIDIDNNPLSEKSAKVGDKWHFVSYLGDIQPISAGRRGPRPEKAWPATTADERAANWRPAGWHWTAGGSKNRLWVGMTPNGYDGSHKDPATEVWLFDTRRKKRLQRIELKTMALSIDVTNEPEPKLLVVNIEGGLDVYDGLNGDFQHTVNQLGATPYVVHRLQ